jgi:hypothetical protein
MYCSPLAALQISKFNRGGMGTAWRPSRDNVAGLKVDAFMSGVYGYEIPVVVKKDWNDFPTTLKQYGGWVFIVDRRSEEYLTETTWEIRNEASHGIMFGVV